MNHAQQTGFTLTEVLVVMGLIILLSGLAVVSLVNPQIQANSAASTNQLINDLRAQQSRAMAGDSLGAASSQPHGIFVQPGGYTLFKGTSYSAADPDNFVVNAEPGITFSTNLASSQVVFTKLSGDVTDFNASANTITVAAASGETKVITLNRYGVYTLN